MATDGLSIGRAAQQLGVSARTLRYYGELGLLDGARRGAGEYRTYDEAALARARQILVLRKLRVPLSSIGAILRSSDARLAIEAFEANIAAIDGELAALQSIRAVLRALVAKLRDAAVWPDALPSGEAIERAARSLLPAIKDAKEDATMDDLNRAGQQLGKLTDVRMLYLPPATVAASHYIGEEPERLHARRTARRAGDAGQRLERVGRTGVREHAHRVEALGARAPGREPHRDLERLGVPRLEETRQGRTPIGARPVLDHHEQRLIDVLPAELRDLPQGTGDLRAIGQRGLDQELARLRPTPVRERLRRAARGLTVPGHQDLSEQLRGRVAADLADRGHREPPHVP